MAEVRAFLLLSCAYGANAASCPRGHCGPSPQEKASRLTEATASKHGEKWTCEKCSTKFYDLNKKGPNNGAVCPECGNEVFKVVVLPPGTPRKPKSRSSFSRGGRPASSAAGSKTLSISQNASGGSNKAFGRAKNFENSSYTHFWDTRFGWPGNQFFLHTLPGEGHRSGN